jgi:hypothetical protein
VAQRLNPGGVLIGAQEDLQVALEQTQRHIDKGTETLFEPTFQFNGLLVRVDILTRREAAYELREVKASASVRPSHLPDAAIQAWVLRNAGVPVSSVQLQHVDTTFVYPGEQEYSGLFKSRPIDEDIRPLLSKVESWLNGAQETLAGNEPERKTGGHCSKPFDCAHLDYCRGQEPELPLYPLAILPYSAKLAAKLVEEGIGDIREIPPGRLANNLQERVRRVTASGNAELTQEAGDILRGLPYPRYYFDFETVGFAVPIWTGTRPYRQVPFQWSCHIEDSSGTLNHRAYLDVSGTAPMHGVVASMLEALGQSGPILAYGAGFERTCIEELARLVPQFAEDLRRLNDRFVDLLDLTRRSYYHPEMRGSWSLKAVLPTIAPDLDYENLDLVRDGGDAQAAYLEAASSGVPAERRLALKVALEKYCERDTLALVRLCRFLERASSSSSPK